MLESQARDLKKNQAWAAPGAEACLFRYYLWSFGLWGRNSNYNLKVNNVAHIFDPDLSNIIRGKTELII